ncbi:MAG: hypothetical protein WCP06_03045 [Verrucomicrobiota bacterium]
MRKIIAAAIGLSSCAVRPQTAPSTAALRVAVQTATVSAQRATENAKVAKAAIERARKSEGPGSAPALTEAYGAVEGTIEQLDATQAALGASESRIESLHVEVENLTQAAEFAESGRMKEAAAKAFWRGCALKLGAMSLALLLWTLRRPIAAMAGVPIP